MAPHPESAMVVPASEAVTEQAKGKGQAVAGLRVASSSEEDKEEKDVEVVGARLKKMGLENGREAEGERRATSGLPDSKK